MAFWSKEAEKDHEAARREEAGPTPEPAAQAPTKKEKSMARDDRQTGEIHTIIGRGASFEGKLTFEGTVRVDGSFKGEIFTDDVLVVGEGARLEAEIMVGTLVVNGEIKGNVTATQGVELHQPAKVVGNIATPSIVIDKGVIFEGNCRMQNLEKPRKPGQAPATPAEGGKGEQK